MILLESEKDVGRGEAHSHQDCRGNGQLLALFFTIARGVLDQATDVCLLQGLLQKLVACIGGPRMGTQTVSTLSVGKG